MFDFLKKKISGFVDNLTKKEEEKPKEKIEEPKEEIPKVEEIPKTEEKAPEPEKIEIPEEKPEIVKEPPKKVEKPVPEKKVEKPKKVEKKPAIKPEKPPEPKVKVPIEKIKEKIEKVLPKKEEKPEAPKVEEKIEKPVEEKVVVPEKKVEEKPAEVEEVEEKPKERIKLGAVTKIKSIITREVEIKEEDVKDLLETLELELLESDVELSVAESIREELMEKLVGAKIKKDELHPFVSSKIRETLIGIITNESAFDIVEKVNSLEKPVKIMFLGINGAGKTTTIAKVAKLLMNNEKKVVFAAADTFRAAAIEQMDVHANRLGVKMIKRDYGDDPTSVAYDAMNYAKAKGIDAVLIDTAGRQDTNISLINEVKKMNRVIKPEITVYIGESIAGNAIIEQIDTFNKEIGIDGVILTKLDCDPKGGTMLSINKTTNIPIIYVGIGQSYEDLEAFDPERIVDRIIE